MTPSIDLAAEAAALLARMAASDEAQLSESQVIAAARLGGLNPKTELQACLRHLKQRRVIDVAANSTIAVLGVTGRTALSHAAGLFEENDLQPFERAFVRAGGTRLRCARRGRSRPRVYQRRRQAHEGRHCRLSSEAIERVTLESLHGGNDEAHVGAPHFWPARRDGLRARIESNAIGSILV